MQIAIVGAGYTAGEADELRRDMAAWKRSAKLLRHEDKLVQGFVAARHLAGVRRPALLSDQRFRRVRLSRVARGIVRASGLRVGVDQSAPPARVRVRAHQLAADGLLLRVEHRPRRPKTRRLRAAARRLDEPLGLHDRIDEAASVRSKQSRSSDSPLPVSLRSALRLGLRL